MASNISVPTYTIQHSGGKSSWQDGEIITANSLNKMQKQIKKNTDGFSSVVQYSNTQPTNEYNQVWIKEDKEQNERTVRLAEMDDFDNFTNNVVVVSQEEPDNEVNKLWIHTGFDTEVQIPTYDEFNEVKNVLTEFKDEAKAGINNITSDKFVSGQWSMVSPSGSSSSPRNIRTNIGYAVKPGDILITKPGTNTLYIRWAVFDANDTVVEERRGYYDKATLADTTFTFTTTGTLYINIANGYNYGNSTNISPADMDADIKLSCFYATTKIAEIENEITDINEKTEYLFNKVIDEEPSASAVSYLYYPYDFNVGQTYIVKIKFTSFSSSTTRKYSLRTTTFKYLSSPYLVQVVATVDTTAPIIGEEYVYKFTATARASGAIGHYLALELSVNAQTDCTLEVYSIKAEDNKTAIDNLSFIVDKDIVSLNHDVPKAVLNGEKPFTRATTVPFALLHFSDIHAAQANLARLVDMGNYLGSTIDDIICTGDMVSNNYSATSMDFWNAVDGAENILMVVGNHDLADGSHGYSSDQIGQTVAYQTYFAPYVSNWGVTMAGENLTYWYKDYATKKVRLIGLNYLLTGDASAAQKTWLAARLAEAKTAEYAVVIAEHSPLNSFTQINCNFNIIGKPWGYAEVLADIQSAVQDFIDGGGEFACYIAGHSHCDYVGYNSNYPDQLCIVVTTATTSGLDNDQRRVAGEKSQDAANVVLVDTVTKTVKLVRIGADMDTYLRGRNLMIIRYTDKTIIAQS